MVQLDLNLPDACVHYYHYSSHILRNVEEGNVCEIVQVSIKFKLICTIYCIYYSFIVIIEECICISIISTAQRQLHMHTGHGLDKCYIIGYKQV